MTSGIVHVRLMSYARSHVRMERKTDAARAAVLPVVYAAYTFVSGGVYTRLLSRVSYVTFPVIITISIYIARFDTLRSYELSMIAILIVLRQCTN